MGNYVVEVTGIDWWRDLAKRNTRTRPKGDNELANSWVFLEYFMGKISHKNKNLKSKNYFSNKQSHEMLCQRCKICWNQYISKPHRSSKFNHRPLLIDPSVTDKTSSELISGWLQSLSSCKPPERYTYSHILLYQQQQQFHDWAPKATTSCEAWNFSLNFIHHPRWSSDNAAVLSGTW